MKSILLFVSFFLILSISPSIASQAPSLLVHAKQATQAQNPQTKPHKKMLPMKQIRAVKKAIRKSSIFAYVSIGFSVLTILAVVSFSSAALATYLTIVGGLLILAIVFLVLAVVAMMKEMKTE